MTSTISAGRRGQVVRSEAVERYRTRITPINSVRPVPQAAESPTPIWLAALEAATRRASDDSEMAAVRWNCVSGRAFYTNSGSGPEVIHPLGVKLEGGQTLAVWWMPGATSYSMEVYGRSEARA